MSQRSLLLFAFAVLAPGCVPVAEPVGDIGTAVPNKELLGTWQSTDTEQWVVDRPDVKGNPKGLMRVRVVTNGDTDKEVMWCFTTTVGKRTYANLLVFNGVSPFPDCSKEGAYEKWATSKSRGYWVGLLTFKGDELILEGGDKNAFAALMAKEKIGEAGGYSKTPAGWLAKYLEKNGPDAIFDGGNKTEFKRAKKK